MPDPLATTLPDPDNRLRCSFCWRNQQEVKLLIVGPAGNICDQCVDVCLDVIAEEGQDFPVPGCRCSSCQEARGA